MVVIRVTCLSSEWVHGFVNMPSLQSCTSITCLQLETGSLSPCCWPGPCVQRGRRVSMVCMCACVHVCTWISYFPPALCTHTVGSGYITVLPNVAWNCIMQLQGSVCSVKWTGGGGGGTKQRKPREQGSISDFEIPSMHISYWVNKINIYLWTWISTFCDNTKVLWSYFSTGKRS